MTLAQRHKLARTKRGLSRHAVAIRAGMSNAYVSLLEDEGSDGHISNPKLATIEKLAGVLDVPVPWLAFGAGDEPDWGEQPPPARSKLKKRKAKPARAPRARAH